MGSKETRIILEKCISRSVIVALSAQPPGVINCVCVYIYIICDKLPFCNRDSAGVHQFIPRMTFELRRRRVYASVRRSRPNKDECLAQLKFSLADSPHKTNTLATSDSDTRTNNKAGAF
jgi:hypothetical protein